MFCVDRSDSVQRIMRVSYEPGQTMPINAGASAHVLLAWLPDDEPEQLLAHVTFEPFTRNTITTPATLRRRLRETRKLGYAISRSELDVDMLGVAAPVCDATGRVVAAVSIATSAARFTNDQIPVLAKTVMGSAELITVRLRLLADLRYARPTGLGPLSLATTAETRHFGLMGPDRARGARQANQAN